MNYHSVFFLNYKERTKLTVSPSPSIPLPHLSSLQKFQIFSSFLKSFFPHPLLFFQAKEILDFLLSSSARLEKICHCFDQLGNKKQNTMNKESDSVKTHDENDNHKDNSGNNSDNKEDNKSDDDIHTVDDEGSDHDYDEEGDEDNFHDHNHNSNDDHNDNHNNDSKEGEMREEYEDIWESVLGGELFVESWIPDALPKDVREYIQTNLWR